MPVEIFGLPAIICLILGVISGLNIAKKEEED